MIFGTAAEGLALLWLLSQPYLFLPRPEMVEQKCRFILPEVLLGSLTHSPGFHSGGPFKVGFDGAAFHINV